MTTLNLGITIMIIGMSIVFIFLTVMIFAMNVTSKVIGVINKYFPEKIDEPKKLNKKIRMKMRKLHLLLRLLCISRQSKR